MQIQMEVCDLNECDFLETRFIEYDNKDEFYNDGSFTRTKNHEIKGIILHFIKNEISIYEYAPLEISEKSFERWQHKIMENHSDATWIKNIYWRLDEFSCVLVLRNKHWFNIAIKDINIIWDLIQKEKMEDYHHRGPKQKKNTITKIKNIQSYTNDEGDTLKHQGICLIEQV